MARPWTRKPWLAGPSQRSQWCLALPCLAAVKAVGFTREKAPPWRGCTGSSVGWRWARRRPSAWTARGCGHPGGISSQAWTDAGPGRLLEPVHGFWTMEDRPHRARHVVLGENGYRVRRGQRARCLAALRNLAPPQHDWEPQATPLARPRPSLWGSMKRLWIEPDLPSADAAPTGSRRRRRLGRRRYPLRPAPRIFGAFVIAVDVVNTKLVLTTQYGAHTGIIAPTSDLATTARMIGNGKGFDAIVRRVAGNALGPMTE